MATAFLSSKTRFSMSSRVLSSNDLEDGLWLSRGDLTVLCDHTLLDLLVGLRKEGSGAQVHKISLGIAKNAVVKVIHKV